MVKTIENQYQKKTQIEHILLRPDTYIGSIEKETQTLYVLNTTQPITSTSASTVSAPKPQGKIISKEISYVPGLYKIFDEILVNAADNKIRDSYMTYIKVTIDRACNYISIENDGRGIPIVLHKKEKVYIPELIFGQLLTSSNYDDEEKKVTGGRNGYGAKLCNIFSSKFIVETQSDGKYYKQVFERNMSVKGEPEIGPGIGKRKSEFTRISFYPDLDKFKMMCLEEDIVNLMMKRVYDMAGIVENVSVYLNDEFIDIKNFVDYCKLYFPVDATTDCVNSINFEGDNVEADGFFEGANPCGDDDSHNITKIAKKKKKIKKSDEKVAVKKDQLNGTIFCHTVVNNRWEVVFTSSEDQFTHVSFVNSICTSKGGTHVNHVVDQISTPILNALKKKAKDVAIKPLHIKNNMFIFVKSLIENPTFDSQTKEYLTLSDKNFGSKCESDEIKGMVKKIISNKRFMEIILDQAKANQKAILKRTDGAKSSHINGMEKLHDANFAGKKDSSKCTLILTEGDSALALAIAGISVVGRDHYGAFPLKGKLLNVREASYNQIKNNTEILALKKILGLQHQKVYENTNTLRYGHLMIMTDQDHDGSHIKGLLINFFEYFFPSLLKIKGFLQEFITPIVRVSKAGVNGTIDFYTLPEFYKWQQETHNSDKYTIKYYKGLGTSTSRDGKFYFTNLDKHVKNFDALTANDRDHISLAFNKKKADMRKMWLKNFVPGTFMDKSSNLISITDFVNKELILFSMADNVRSIPNVIDGFKPGQRKVLYTMLSKKILKEIKVAQLAGKVSEFSVYHHGEQSLCMTIINLAQNHVGSNNINLLYPSGQFGTRLQGGKDNASPRYIFTRLSNITLSIFKNEDTNILKYLDEENQKVEPEYYAPIIPMVLVNGAEGIGTGWSTSIPKYNVKDIIKNIRRMLRGEKIEKMYPYYRGFKGKIEPIHGEVPRTINNDLNNVIIKNNDDNKIGESNSDILDHRIDFQDVTTQQNSTITPLFTPEGTPRISRFKSKGIYNLINDEDVEISELPVGTWTESYIKFLSEKIKLGILEKNINDHSSELDVSINISIIKDINRNNIEESLKLYSLISTSNMVCFDHKGMIKKYDGPEEILEEFFMIRLNLYTERKQYLLNTIYNDIIKAENRIRFIKEVVEGTQIIIKRKKIDIENDLTKKEYVKIDNGYDYLLNMPIISLTIERIEKLNNEREELKRQYDIIYEKSNKDLWNNDLDMFEKEYQVFLDEIEKENNEFPAIKRKGKKSRKKIKKIVKDDDQSDETSDIKEIKKDNKSEVKNKKVNKNNDKEKTSNDKKSNKVKSNTKKNDDKNKVKKEIKKIKVVKSNKNEVRENKRKDGIQEIMKKKIKIDSDEETVVSRRNSGKPWKKMGFVVDSSSSEN